MRCWSDLVRLGNVVVRRVEAVTAAPCVVVVGPGVGDLLVILTAVRGIRNESVGDSFVEKIFIQF